MLGLVRDALSYPFMVNALRAGTIAAVLAGAVGWLVVLRRETLVAHTLTVVGFPGAALAVWTGTAPAVGYLGATVLVALGLALRGPGLADGATVGSVQAGALAVGFLVVALYRGYATGASSLLFGTLVGVTSGQVLLLLVVAAGALLALCWLGRPLVLTSLDSAVAQVRGVPTRLVGAAFLVVLAVAAAEVSQVTGSLLVFALLVLPAAAAHELTPRAGWGVALSIAIGVAVTWVALLAGFATTVPVGFWLTTLAFGCYLLARFRPARAAR